MHPKLGPKKLCFLFHAYKIRIVKADLKKNIYYDLFSFELRYDVSIKLTGSVN